MRRFTVIGNLPGRLALALMLALSTQSCNTTVRTTERNETLESHSATGRTETTLRDRYDSIYVLHDRSTNTVNDTVWEREKITEFRYRYLHDTALVTRTDTLIVTRTDSLIHIDSTVTTTSPGGFASLLRGGWVRVLSYGSLLLLVLLLLYRIRSPTSLLKR